MQCYEELLSKFSGSASLHLDFAHFCEAVLNDEVRAHKYRHGAEILESGALFFFFLRRCRYHVGKSVPVKSFF